MSNAPVKADVTAMPCATILAFPTERQVEPFLLSHADWTRAFAALCTASPFAADIGLDMAMLEMIETRPSSVERIIVDNGKVLADLFKAVAFLAAIDQRIGASAARVLSREGC